MLYDRKIKYLDYLENGDKVRNAGFVKIEAAGDYCNIQINVTGLYTTDTLSGEVMIGNGKKETLLGNVELISGKGSLALKKVSLTGIGQDNMTYEELSHIRLGIGKNREVMCRWNDKELDTEVRRETKENASEYKREMKENASEYKRETKENASEYKREMKENVSEYSKAEISQEENDLQRIYEKDAEYRRQKHRETEYQGKEYQGKEYRGKEYQEKEYQGKEYQEKEYQGKEYQGKEYQEKEYQGKEYQGREYQGKDYKRTKLDEVEYEESLYREIIKEKNNDKKDNTPKFIEGVPESSGDQNVIVLNPERQSGSAHFLDQVLYERFNDMPYTQSESSEREISKQQASEEVMWGKAETDLPKESEKVMSQQLETEKIYRQKNEELAEKADDDGLDKDAIYIKWMGSEDKTVREDNKVREDKTVREDNKVKEDKKKVEVSDKKASGSPSKYFDEKWKQLTHIYPHITPFQDEREYLSIEPDDFVILQKNCHKLVNNSFLLHGFYNYEHLILTKVFGKGGGKEERFYVGVPGNFYEREKQVAIMFGFESFECKTEPAQTGDFGYYMIRVEL